MAEFVPLQYRLRMAQKEQAARWIAWNVLGVILAAASLTSTCVWQHRQAKARDTLQTQYQVNAIQIPKSQDLRSHRQELAGRMQQVEQLVEDQSVLTLLQYISTGIGNSDALEYVSIDSHVQNRPAADPDSYVVLIHGITANSTTLSQLMTRLTTNMNVVLESTTRENSIEGHPMRFQIRCEKSQPKGT